MDNRTFRVAIILNKNSFGESSVEATNLFGATIIDAALTHYPLMIHDSELHLPNSLQLAIVLTAPLSYDVASNFVHQDWAACHQH